MAPVAQKSGTVTEQPLLLATWYLDPHGRPIDHPVHGYVEHENGAVTVDAPSEKEIFSRKLYGMLTATVHEDAGPVQVEEVFTLAGVTTTGPWALATPTVQGHACPAL